MACPDYQSMMLPILKVTKAGLLDWIRRGVSQISARGRRPWAMAARETMPERRWAGAATVASMTSFLDE
jgi:hypothetical protein